MPIESPLRLLHESLLRAAAAVLLLLALTPARAQLAPGEGLLVDLSGLRAAEVEALKRSHGAGWWVEAGATLLLVGDIDVLRVSIPGERRLQEVGRLHPDGLALHARGCNDPRASNDASLLLPGDTHDLVRRPISFSPLGLGKQPFDGTLGAPEHEPVAANSTIARMRRLDRETAPGTKAATLDPAVVQAVQSVDPDRWFEDVVDLAAFDRSSFSTQLPQARAWLAARFAELDLEVSEPFFFFPYAAPLPLANVAGFWTGTTYPDEWIVVGGHYDSRREINDPANAGNTPGADDNASGCAGVLEVARAVLPFQPERSILFICYAGEEQGLFGSFQHVNSVVSAGMLGRLKAMLNMDMIGWTPDTILGVHIGTRIDLGTPTANRGLANLLADAALDYVPALNPDHVTISTASCCSDHMPYLNAGVPATLSIHRGGTSYPHYHRFSDTPANLGPRSRDIGAAIVGMNVAALAQLAGIRSYSIDAGISGLWFDPERDGEGFGIEIIEDDQAVVVWYTYDLDGSQMWLIGTGAIDGGRLLVEELVRPVGARFGADFDPDDVERQIWGSLQIEFDDCGSGRFTFHGPEDHGSGSYPLQRLGQMSGVGCGSHAGVGSELSGLFLDLSRDGEGFSIQFLDAGDDDPVPVGLWFTFTPEGEQAWLIGGGVLQDGHRFVADLVQQPIGARFGSGFDADDVQRLHWGEWTIDFTGCNAAALSYHSSLPGYEALDQNLVRLSRPLGVDCPPP